MGALEREEAGDARLHEVAGAGSDEIWAGIELDVEKHEFRLYLKS